MGLNLSRPLLLVPCLRLRRRPRVVLRFRRRLLFRRQRQPGRPRPRAGRRGRSGRSDKRVIDLDGCVCCHGCESESERVSVCYECVRTYGMACESEFTIEECGIARQYRKGNYYESILAEPDAVDLFGSAHNYPARQWRRRPLPLLLPQPASRA